MPVGPVAVVVTETREQSATRVRDRWADQRGLAVEGNCKCRYRVDSAMPFRHGAIGGFGARFCDSSARLA